jgi:thioredoxin-like negative regulator of GroEL
MSGEEKKVEIMYFYSDLYESKRRLLPIIRRLQRKRKDIQIRLVNIEEPENSELAELYGVNSVPLVIFLTPKGEVASRKSIPLSDENTINDIANQIIKGDLPKPNVNELKRKILDSFKSVSRRNDLTQLIVEQIESDILEADSETEIYDAINLHISTINHTISDLEEYKIILQKYLRKKQDFII